MFTHRNFLHNTKLAHDENLHLTKLHICRFAHFCIWKIICAADLRILCTTVFRTFADLRICRIHICTFADLHFEFVRRKFAQ